MIKIVVKFKIRKGMEEAYLRELLPCILAARSEPGNQEYTVFWDADTNTATLFEQYGDQTDLDAHMQYSHCKEDFLALRKYYDGEVEVSLYRDAII